MAEINLIYNEETGRSTKRQRRDSHEGQSLTQMANSGTRLLRKIGRVVNNMIADIRATADIIKDPNPNTRKEIKERITRLSSDASLLATEDLKRILEDGIIAEPAGADTEAQSIQLDTASEDRIHNMEEKIEMILAAIARIADRDAAVYKEERANPPKAKTAAEVLKKGKDNTTPEEGRTKESGTKTSKSREPDQKITTNKKSSRSNIRDRAERIVVDTEGSSYADTLRRVKAGLPSALSEKIRNAKKSKAGNLVVELNKGTDSMTIQKELQDIVGSEKAKITSGSKITLEVKGLEEDATAQDVMDAFKRENCKGNYTVKEIRKYGTDLRIGMIEANRTDALSLLDLGHIKIG